MAFDAPGMPYYDPIKKGQSLARLPNPMWFIGDKVRQRQSRSRNPEIWNYTELALLGINEEIPWMEQMEALAVPWFFTGWLFNPSLERISGSNSTKNAEYFSDRGFTHFEGDIPTHVAYYMTLMKVNKFLEPRAVGRPKYIGKPRGFRPGMSNFTRRISSVYTPGLRIGEGGSNRVQFIDDEHEDGFVQFSVNANRMLLYHFRSELRDRGRSVAGSMSPEDRGLNWIEGFLNKADPDGDHARLLDEIRYLLTGAEHEPADLNFDGVVDSADMRQFFRDFRRRNEHADLNGDEVFDMEDYNMIRAHFPARRRSARGM